MEDAVQAGLTGASNRIGTRSQQGARTERDEDETPYDQVDGEASGGTEPDADASEDFEVEVDDVDVDADVDEVEDELFFQDGLNSSRNRVIGGALDSDLRGVSPGEEAHGVQGRSRRDRSLNVATVGVVGSMAGPMHTPSSRFGNILSPDTEGDEDEVDPTLDGLELTYDAGEAQQIAHELELFRTKWQSEVEAQASVDDLTTTRTGKVSGKPEKMNMNEMTTRGSNEIMDKGRKEPLTEVKDIREVKEVATSVPNEGDDVSSLKTTTPEATNVAREAKVPTLAAHGETFNRPFKMASLGNSGIIRVNGKLVPRDTAHSEESRLLNALRIYCRATNDERLGRLGSAVDGYRESLRWDAEVHARYTQLVRMIPSHPWVTGIRPLKSSAAAALEQQQQDSLFNFHTDYDFDLNDFGLEKVPEPYYITRESKTAAAGAAKPRSSVACGADTKQIGGGDAPNETKDTQKIIKKEAIENGQLSKYSRVSDYINECLTYESIRFKPKMLRVNGKSIEDEELKKRTQFFNLPPEVVQLIVNITVRESPSSIRNLSKVSRQMYLHTTSNAMYKFLRDSTSLIHNDEKSIKETSESVNYMVDILPPFAKRLKLQTTSDGKVTLDETNRPKKIKCNLITDLVNDLDSCLSYSKTLTTFWNSDKNSEYRGGLNADPNDESFDKYIEIEEKFKKAISPRTLSEHGWITNPRIRHDGVYISRIHYISVGKHENAPGDKVNLINYFRYFRFLPDGRRCISWTTTLEPHLAVRRLLDYEHNRAKGFMYGEYVVMKRPYRRKAEITSKTIGSTLGTQLMKDPGFLSRELYETNVVLTDDTIEDLDANKDLKEPLIKKKSKKSKHKDEFIGVYLPKEFDGGVSTSYDVAMTTTKNNMGVNAIDWKFSSMAANKSNGRSGGGRKITRHITDVTNGLSEGGGDDTSALEEQQRAAIMSAIKEEEKIIEEDDAQVYFVLRDPHRKGISFNGVLSLESSSLVKLEGEQPFGHKNGIKLEGTELSSGRNNKLSWKSYWISKDDNPEYVSPIPLEDMNTFYFSRVKSYPSSLVTGSIDDATYDLISNTLKEDVPGTDSLQYGQVSFKKCRNESERVYKNSNDRENGNIPVDLDMPSVSILDRIMTIRWAIRWRILLFGDTKLSPFGDKYLTEEHVVPTIEPVSQEREREQSTIKTKPSSKKGKNNLNIDQNDEIINFIHGWNLLELAKHGGSLTVESEATTL